jgi:hypothetical protein
MQDGPFGAVVRYCGLILLSLALVAFSFPKPSSPLPSSITAIGPAPISFVAVTRAVGLYDLSRPATFSQEWKSRQLAQRHDWRGPGHGALVAAVLLPLDGWGRHAEPQFVAAAIVASPSRAFDAQAPPRS